ncbi:MAG TPA: TonB-dependent siderophore receptor, partial [Sphingomicrobium sp.]|nr:TonB-dependent siderophore receptor [Sphingomicrobium sp.]
DIRYIPQAITTISSAQVEDQQLRSMGDLLLFVPGASYGAGEGNRDQVVLRGNSSTADFFVDGIRDDVQYFRDFYNVDRVEVLKGPDAMIFGRGGGGGIVNRVLKRPSLSNESHVSSSIDNWGAKRITADVDKRLADSFGLRLDSMFEDSDGFRHYDNLRRYGINPTAALLAGGQTRVDLGFEHFHDERTADRGVPADGNQPLHGYTRAFFGDPRVSYSRATVDIATLTAKHEFTSSLDLRNHTEYGTYRKFYQNVFPNSFDPATSTVALAGYNNRNNRTTLYTQTDLVWRTRSGGFNQTVLFGFDLGSERSRNRHLTASFVQGGTTPLSQPTISAEVRFAAGASDANNRVSLSYAGIYVQDQVRIGTWFEIIAGARFDALKTKLQDLRLSSGQLFDRRDNLWSPRIGIVLKPRRRLSFYASYSRSYLPQSGDQFSSLTSVTAGLQPERFDNHEVGAKLQLPGGILATIAAYQLDRTNTRATDPTNPALLVLTGAQRSHGVEVGLERSVTARWLVSMGYALQNATIVSATTSAPAGRAVPLVPRQSFSMWNRYALSRRTGVGMGLITRSKSYATISNAVKLPGYVRVDAALSYKLASSVDVQVNVENLFGVHYFPTASADNNIIPGALRTVKATLAFKY